MYTGVSEFSTYSRPAIVQTHVAVSSAAGDPRDTVPERAVIRGKRPPNSSGFAPITMYAI